MFSPAHQCIEDVQTCMKAFELQGNVLLRRRREITTAVNSRRDNHVSAEAEHPGTIPSAFSELGWGPRSHEPILCELGPQSYILHRGLLGEGFRLKAGVGDGALLM